ncbi:23S rRNA (uracil(1939)-C(5))-methyltransferase RlmD [Candidatus Woesearchaeota archaeon]|nr:23S rRNA (uracil(1939)-C(5))-methyltransferase RlmD [Candidatus Woesearchaeota archaeon]
MEPKCPYFGACGGCTSQHVEYSQQIESKKKIVASICGIDDVKVFSGNECGYRNRMDFIFSTQGIGLRKKNSPNTIIPIDECAIAEPKINSLLAELNGFFKDADAFENGKGTFRYAVIRSTSKSSSISFVLNSDSTSVAAAIEKIKEFAEASSAENIAVTYTSPEQDNSVSEDCFYAKGSGMLEESLLGKDFIFSVQGFFQNNTFVAEKMQEYINSIMKSHNTADAYLLDLYAGVGTFGIINAGLFKKVFIVESFKGCIEAANKNLEANKVQNAEAICIDAKQLKRLKLPSPLYVITDPPRSGMDQKTIEELNRLKPEAIIYISCNTRQLAKDLKKFSKYKIKSAALFDLFPQTQHIEAVVELVLKQY